MSSEFYNLIMHGDSEFWSGVDGYVDFPKQRFLEYTDKNLKNKFQSLDKDVINTIKKFPTFFAVEDEAAETRIGKVKDVKVFDNKLRIYYDFDGALPKGLLKRHYRELKVDKTGLEFYRTHWAIKEVDISKTLLGIAHQLKKSSKKVQLIYAFNGSGKTRLSREFKELVTPKMTSDEAEERYAKVIYYNAFTEDLFYWDNDLARDVERKLKIQPNNYTQWVLEEQGQDQNAISHFQYYTSDKLTPSFSEDFTEVSFSFERGNDEGTGNVKISKGEESIFIWSIFYSLLEQIISVLNVSNRNERETDRYDQLEYVFIDDPVTSLDENHLIELAVNVAKLIKSSKKKDLHFIITTHNPIFYNVIYNELKQKDCYILSKLDGGGFFLEEKKGDSNRSFAYHLHIKNLIEQAIEKNNIQRYHFTLLRNLYEKTAAFFGYKEWADLLDTVEGDKKAYFNRIIQFSSHLRLSNEEISEPTEPEKQTVKLLLANLTNNYGVWPKQEEQHG